MNKEKIDTRGNLIEEIKDEYEKTAAAIREAKKTFLTSSLARQKNSEENPGVVIKMLINGIKHNLKKAKEETFINNVDEAEKELKKVEDINKRATYLQIQLLLDKIIDKISYAISIEEPDFDMEVFRRRCRSIETKDYRHGQLRSENYRKRVE